MMELGLWGDVLEPARDREQPGGAFDQWMTPEWAAALLVERHFGDLDGGDFVVEPSAGRGAWLKALPEDVPAIGVELDPVLAAECAAETGREVLVGDFRTIALPRSPTVILGNPPFRAELVDAFIDRAWSLLPEDGRCGLLLPAYAFQTPSRVNRWAEMWAIAGELIPRTLFSRSRLPLLFVRFTKQRVRTMVGFALYREAAALEEIGARAKLVLVNGRARMGVWKALVVDTLERLGGEASLGALYAAIEGKRPTGNPWWREKVRQVVQQCCQRVGPGVWRLAE